MTGQVADHRGWALPGVTVEVCGSDTAFPARKAVTNSLGHFAIMDLRPGIYAVRFSCGGFSSVVRERVDLSSGLVATVNAQLEIIAAGASKPSAKATTPV